MLNANHPGDERLSALASQDADAVADAPLADHVASCARCASIVDELGALRANLAILPDLAPSRPLRLVPDVTGGADRLGSYVRKVFGPVMAAGAALALVGMVGTAGPSLFQAAGPAADSQAAVSAASAPESFTGGVERASQRLNAGEAAGGTPYSQSQTDRDEFGPLDGEDQPGAEAFERDPTALQADAERSPWPMVLFTGIAVLVAGALLRWIVAPRAG